MEPNIKDTHLSKLGFDIHYECKLDTINRILEIYPNLQSERTTIMAAIFNHYQKPNRYILKKIKYNNIDLYEDPSGMLLDSDLNFMGFIFDKKFFMKEPDNSDIDYIDIQQLDTLMKERLSIKK